MARSRPNLITPLRNIVNSPISRLSTDEHPARSFIKTTALLQIPTLMVIALSEAVTRYSGSGYNLIIIALLGTVIYTSLRGGMVQGLISAILIVLYNFHLVSEITGYDFLSLENLQRGGVIAFVFPVLAIIVGRLKERNDALLRGEKIARLHAEDSARQLQFMAESMPQKIFTVLPDGTADYVNPQWNEYLKPSSKKSRETRWQQIVHPDDYEENNRLWRRSLKTGKPFQFEHRLRRSDGVYRWHLSRAHALRDEKGEISLWIGSSTDIEDVKKTQKLEADTARLIKQRTQLMELNTAKDEFISLASHQLRTPATGVKQFINMALDGFAGPLTPDLKTLLEKANESNERQLSVINDLLQVAQVDAGKVNLRKEQVDVTDLIKNVISEQSSKFSKRKQTVKYEDQKKRISVMADPTKLRMVLENLIDNAGKYSPDGTKITVRTSSSRGKVRISVTDQGVGIKKEDIDKLFQKFTRLDNPFSTIVGGTGLGLYWGRKVIDLHGGDISVTSKEGKGTTFTITLPTYSSAMASTKK